MPQLEPVASCARPTAMTSHLHDVQAQPRPAGQASRRPGTIVSWCAAAAICALLAAGCGSAAPAAGPSGSASTAAAAAAKVSLEVTFSGSASTPPSHYTLHCEPTGGTARDAATACATLLRGGILKGSSLFGPLPVRRMCPMILATAGRVTITGTFLGRRVHETVLDGGCDLARWLRLREIFN